MALFGTQWPGLGEAPYQNANLRSELGHFGERAGTLSRSHGLAHDGKYPSRLRLAPLAVLSPRPRLAGMFSKSGKEQREGFEDCDDQSTGLEHESLGDRPGLHRLFALPTSLCRAGVRRRKLSAHSLVDTILIIRTATDVVGAQTLLHG